MIACYSSYFLSRELLIVSARKCAEMKAIYACEKVNHDRNKSKVDHKVARAN